LLTLSFELLAKATGLTPQQRIDCVCVLAQAVGGAGMVGGQWLDIAGGVVTPEQLERIAKTKTAAFIASCVEIGAIIANSPERALLRQFGEQIGLAFQIADDLKDLDDDAPTYPSIVGEAASIELVQQLKSQAMATLRQLQRRRQLLEELAEQMVPLPVTVPC
jgi:geranylgeranyl pyrophosphate synthase